MTKKSHWFISPTGHMFYAVKILNSWRFIGKSTYIIKETEKFSTLRSYVESVFGFDYVGYM
jgi:hypothetical protein